MSKDFTKEQEKAIKALQKFESIKTVNRISAYIVIAPDAHFEIGKSNYKLWGKVRVLFPAGGQGQRDVKVFVGDSASGELQVASGYNADEAMSNILFDGFIIENDRTSWQHQLEVLGYTIIQAI